jgi:hypothetical protein
MKRSVVCAAVAAIAVGACSNEVTLPDPPRQAEVDAAAAVYESPTGTIDVANIQATLDGIEARLMDMQLDWLPALIAESLTRIAARADDASLTSETEDGADTAEHTRVDAVVTLRRVCRGWSDPAGLPDQATNGFVELTAVIDDSAARPDVWGGATACKTRLDPLAGASAITVTPSPSVNLSIDGTLDIRLYGPLPRSVGDAKFLLLFSGRLGTDARTVELSFDFRALDGQLAFRYAVSDGEIIVEVGLTSVSLRGSNATFTCDLASRSCQ